MTGNKTVMQLIWGSLLVLAGIGVLFRIPQVMPRIEQIQYFSSIILLVRISFYLMAIILIGGGIQKIYKNYQLLSDSGNTKGTHSENP